MGGSFLLCKIRGIPIRVHWSFFLLPLLFLYGPLVARDPGAILFGAALVVFLAVAIVAHEMAHALVGRRLGAVIHDIVLWPLGGFTQLSGLPSAPSAQVMLSLAGPFTNLGLAGLAFIATGQFGFHTYAGAFVWVNLALGVLNLAPTQPFDGGHAVLAFLRGKLGYGPGDLWAGRIGVATAAALIVLGLLWGEMFIVILGVISMVLSWRSMSQAALVAGPRQRTPKAPETGDFRVWRLPKDELKDEIEQHRKTRHSDREVRERVDRLLKQISEQGIESLTEEDRQFLKEAADQFSAS